MAQIPNNPANRKSAEMGALHGERVHAHFAGHQRQLRYAARARSHERAGAPTRASSSPWSKAPKLGNYDLFDDPENPDQIAVGQFTERDNRAFFDIWTHFPARAGKPRAPLGLELSDFRIEATVEPDLNLSAVTRVKVKTAVDGIRVVPFDVAREMAVSEVKVNGMPAEVLQREAPKGNFGRGENDLFLVMPAAPLRAGVEYEFEFHHSGRVIVQMAEHVFYVAARANWYPSFGAQLATYDLSFRYPRDWELVTPGDVVEDRTEGDWRITRRRPSAPIRMAGFNLGEYAHAQVNGAGYVVDIYANRRLDPALAPRPILIAPPPRTRPGLDRNAWAAADLSRDSDGRPAGASATPGLDSRFGAGIHDVEVRPPGAFASHRLAHPR